MAKLPAPRPTIKDLAVTWLVVLLSAFASTIYRQVRERMSESEGKIVATTKDGTAAQNPTELAPVEWKHALKETYQAVRDKDLNMFAAGVSYFATLAFFPTLTAIVSLYALAAEPRDIVRAAHSLQQFLPADMASLITKQLVTLSTNTKASLIGGLIAAAIALWSASSGTQNLIKALNHFYDVDETRSFVRLRLISLAIVLGLIVVAVPVAGLLFLQDGWLSIARWPLLAVIVTLVLAAIYRYAPDRRQPKWQIVSWGGAAATIIWLIGTALFFLYVTYVADFGKTYGIFAGLIILMVWLYNSAMIILVGAEVNNRLERRVE